MKTLFISDLDGTLLNTSAVISDYSIKTLNKMIEKGIDFTVATARALDSVKVLLKDLNVNLPVVLLNGVLVYDMDNKVYAKVNTIKPKTADAVIETIRKFEITGFMYELKNNEIFTYHESFEKEPMRDFMAKRIKHYSESPEHNKGFKNAHRERIIYFTMCDAKERIQPVYDKLSNLLELNLTMYNDVYMPDLWYLEIFSSQASKGSAAESLRKEYGFEKVACFGDNYNDLTMFEVSDISVAPENAKAEVRKKADFICGPNDKDGVTHWIEENWENV